MRRGSVSGATRRRRGEKTDFWKVTGTAGMYSTDESPRPTCSLSTAWTRSQCPARTNTTLARVPPTRYEEAWKGEARTIDLVARLYPGDARHRLVEPQVWVRSLVQDLRFPHFAARKFCPVEVGLPIRESECAAREARGGGGGPEERAQEDVSCGELEEREHAQRALARTCRRKRCPPLPRAEHCTLIPSTDKAKRSASAHASIRERWKCGGRDAELTRRCTSPAWRQSAGTRRRGRARATVPAECARSICGSQGPPTARRCRRRCAARG